MVSKNPGKIGNIDAEFATQPKTTTQKLKNKITFSLTFFVMKIKYHTIFILQNKLLKSVMNFYQYLILKIHIFT